MLNFRSLTLTFVLMINSGGATALSNNWNSLIWPLCGRLGEAPGAWQPGQDCPASRLTSPADFPDFPIHHGYGHRVFTSLSRPISFHRGIDLAARQAVNDPSNPVFSVGAGWVIGLSGIAPDQTLTVQMPRDATALPMTPSCSVNNPCLNAIYQHIKTPRVSLGQSVRRGQHLADSSYDAGSATRFDHLHFEIRDVQGRLTGDSGAQAFSKDARHPLRYLPFRESQVNGQALRAILTSDATAQFGGYSNALGGVRFGVQLQGSEAFRMQLAEVVITPYFYDGVQWQPLLKSATLIQNESGINGLSETSVALNTDYPIADGALGFARYAPETLVRFYAPFPDTNSAWEFERVLTYYRTLLGGNYQSIDDLLERNAGARMSAGTRVHDFDFKLVKPAPNPENANSDLDHRWWTQALGFRGYDFNQAAPVCVRIDARLFTGVFEAPLRTETSFVSIHNARACADVPSESNVFLNGFE